MQQANAQQGYLSRPQHYGGFGGSAPKKAVFHDEERHRLNLASYYQCLFVPWLFFCATYALMSCSLQYFKPAMAYLVLALCAVVVLASGWIPFKLFIGKTALREPSWHIFFFVTMVVAFFLGVVFGNLNYSECMHEYFDYKNLDIFPEVSPLHTKGQQVMSGGRVHFDNNSVLDITRSMSFKNLDTYCVAPISVVEGGTTLPLKTYDFWAVGLGCCSENAADFHCGEYRNPHAHSGLRLLADGQRDFFRLAVQQAEAAHGIKAEHPLFFYWVEDANSEMESFKRDGYKYYLIGVFAHFGWQLLAVSLASAAFAKIGYS